MESPYTMKMENKLFFIVLAWICIMFCSCSSTIWMTQDKQLLPDPAIDMIIDDFLSSPKRRNQKVGEVKLFIGDIDSLNVRYVAVMPYEEDENKWPLDILQERIGQCVRGIPTEYRERSGKLFCWNNPNIPLTQDMIDVLSKYGRILKEGEPWIVITARTEKRHFYFCKSNYKKYKKRFSIITKPPCMHCQ